VADLNVDCDDGVAVIEVAAQMKVHASSEVILSFLLMIKETNFFALVILSTL